MLRVTFLISQVCYKHTCITCYIWNKLFGLKQTCSIKEYSKSRNKLWVSQSTEKRYVVINAVINVPLYNYVAELTWLALCTTFFLRSWLHFCQDKTVKLNVTKWWSSDMRLHCPRQQKESKAPIYEIMAAAVMLQLCSSLYNQIFNQYPFVFNPEYTVHV